MQDLLSARLGGWSLASMKRSIRGENEYERRGQDPRPELWGSETHGPTAPAGSAERPPRGTECGGCRVSASPLHLAELSRQGGGEGEVPGWGIAHEVVGIATRPQILYVFKK